MMKKEDIMPKLMKIINQKYNPTDADYACWSIKNAFGIPINHETDSSSIIVPDTNDCTDNDIESAILEDVMSRPAEIKKVDFLSAWEKAKNIKTFVKAIVSDKDCYFDSWVLAETILSKDDFEKLCEIDVRKHSSKHYVVNAMQDEEGIEPGLVSFSFDGNAHVSFDADSFDSYRCMVYILDDKGTFPFSHPFWEHLGTLQGNFCLHKSPRLQSRVAASFKGSYDVYRICPSRLVLAKKGEK